jgi:hypothetical protein
MDLIEIFSSDPSPTKLSAPSCAVFFNMDEWYFGLLALFVACILIAVLGYLKREAAVTHATLSAVVSKKRQPTPPAQGAPAIHEGAPSSPPQRGPSSKLHYASFKELAKWLEPRFVTRPEMDEFIHHRLPDEIYRRLISPLCHDRRQENGRFAALETRLSQAEDNNAAIREQLHDAIALISAFRPCHCGRQCGPQCGRAVEQKTGSESISSSESHLLSEFDSAILQDTCKLDRELPTSSNASSELSADIDSDEIPPCCKHAEAENAISANAYIESESATAQIPSVSTELEAEDTVIETPVTEGQDALPETLLELPIPSPVTEVEYVGSEHEELPFDMASPATQANPTSERLDMELHDRVVSTEHAQIEEKAAVIQVPFDPTSPKYDDLFGDIVWLDQPDMSELTTQDDVDANAQAYNNRQMQEYVASETLSGLDRCSSRWSLAIRR